MTIVSAVTIREFRFPDDYSEVYEVWRQSSPGVQLRRSDTPEEIRVKVSRDPDLFLVAEANGSIVGTVIGGFDGRRGMIYHLAVAREQRGGGVGSRLMEEVERRLKTKGCLKTYLMVTAGNTEAMDFYEKRGWSRMDLVLLYGKDLQNGI